MTFIKNTAFLFLLILCLWDLSAQEAINLTTKEGREITLETRSVKDSPYISLKELTRLLSESGSRLSTEWDGTFGVLRFTRDQDSYSLFLDKTTLLVNSRILNVDEPVRLIAGEVLIPFSSFKTLNTMWKIYTFQEEKKIKEKEEPTPSPTPLAPSIPVSRERISKPQPTQTPRAPSPGFMKIVIDPASEPLKWDKASPGTSLRPSQDVLTHEIAAGIKKILDQEAGIGVMLTHGKGEALTLEEKIERVNTSGADALVALRLNASQYENLEGVEIFLASESVDPGSQGAKKAGGIFPLAFAYIPYQRDSLVLANAVLEEMDRSGSIRVGPITPAPVYLLKRAAMPSVLISCGYISSPRDASQLSRERYRDTLARAIAGAIMKYKDTVYINKK